MITFDVNQDKTLLMPRMVSEELEVDRVISRMMKIVMDPLQR